MDTPFTLSSLFCQRWFWSVHYHMCKAEMLTKILQVVSTFISHTIASVLLVPIAKEVGSNLSGNHANLLIFITGLICSTGMGMPVSGFPNQTAFVNQNFSSFGK